jgi:hypothetical protein
MNLRPTIPPQCPSELADLIKQVHEFSNILIVVI